MRHAKLLTYLQLISILQKISLHNNSKTSPFTKYTYITVYIPKNICKKVCAWKLKIISNKNVIKHHKKGKTPCRETFRGSSYSSKFLVKNKLRFLTNN